MGLYCLYARSFWISLQTRLTSRGDHHSSSIHHSGLRSNHWVQIWKSITPWLGSTRNLAFASHSWTQRLKARAFLWVWMGWVWNRPCEILGNPFMKLPLAMTKMLFGFFWKNPCYFPNLPIGNPKRNTQKFTQNDPHECSWAVIKTLVGWAIWGIILRSYVGAVISQDKDTY